MRYNAVLASALVSSASFVTYVYADEAAEPSTASVAELPTFTVCVATWLNCLPGTGNARITLLTFQRSTANRDQGSIP